MTVVPVTVVKPAVLPVITSPDTLVVNTPETKLAVTPEIVLLIVTSPELSILILSVGLAAPSAVVLKTSLPGISLLPGVPSTSPATVAASIKLVPSAP